MSSTLAREFYIIGKLFGAMVGDKKALDGLNFSEIVKLGDSMSCQVTVSAAGAAQLTGSVTFSSSGTGSFGQVKCGNNGENGDNLVNPNDGGLVFR